MSTSLSPGLRQLLDAHVESFEKLEVLMLLRRTPAGCTPAELTRALGMGSDDVRSIASALTAAGLVARAPDGRLALSPRTGEDAAALDELVRTYDEDRITLVKAIAEIAMDRLRNLASRAFADAFVIRKKKPGGSDG